MHSKKGRSRRLSRKTAGIWFILMFVFICQLFAYTWCGVQNIREGYDITQKQAEQRRLLAVGETLRIELARLKSPDRIARIAKERLGLVSPSKQQTIDLE